MPRYLRKDQMPPNACPVCNSPETEGDEFVVDGVRAIQECSCNACGSHWRDVYHRKNYFITVKGEVKK